MGRWHFYLSVVVIGIEVGVEVGFRKGVVIGSISI
jgi:hypothetical protein